MRVSIISGQIIATSHDLTPNGGLVREVPLFQGNPGWSNIIIWPDNMLARWWFREVFVQTISQLWILKMFFFFFACNFSNPSIFGECVWIFLYFLGWNPRQVLLRSRSEPPPNIHTCWQFFCWRNHGLELITLNDTESVYIYIHFYLYIYTVG